MLGMGMRIPGMKADVSATITVSSLAEAEAATRGSTGSSSNTGTVKTVRVGKGVNGVDEVKMAVEMEEAAPPTYEDQVRLNHKCGSMSFLYTLPGLVCGDFKMQSAQQTASLYLFAWPLRSALLFQDACLLGFTAALH